MASPLFPVGIVALSLCFPGSVCQVSSLLELLPPEVVAPAKVASSPAPLGLCSACKDLKTCFHFMVSLKDTLFCKLTFFPPQVPAFFPPVPSVLGPDAGALLASS